MPLVYAYGSMRGDYDMAERALDILSMLPAENNIITREWGALGMRASGRSPLAGSYSFKEGVLRHREMSLLQVRTSPPAQGCGG